jgi:type VI secretion system secreted protein Hcp
LTTEKNSSNYKDVHRRLSLTFFQRLTLILAILLLAVSFYLIKSFKVRAQTEGTDQALTTELSTDSVAPSGQVDLFLKIDGIEGESANKGHEKEIALDSYSFGLSNSTISSATGGAGAGKVKFNEFKITKHIDKSSPIFFSYAANGKHIPEVKLSVRKAGGEAPQDFYIVKLTDVIISSYNQDGSSQNGITDQISFNFAKIDITYKPQSARGDFLPAVQSGWDLKANKSL